jgi:hypothetical protein
MLCTLAVAMLASGPLQRWIVGGALAITIVALYCVVCVQEPYDPPPRRR